jgi:formylglycine-generating enzyme required for sulfatase activity
MAGCRPDEKRAQHQPPPPQSRTTAPTRVAPPVPVPGPATKPPRRTPFPPEPEVLRFAVLPLEPLWETTESHRRFAQRKLEKHLQDHPKVELIAAAQVAQAMKELGVFSSSKCDQRCLIRLGRRLGAHRVLGGTVRMQKKVQSKGTVWEFGADLVHVQRGATWGHYQTVCICWRGQQDKLLGRQVSRMLAYHPDRWILKMTRPTPVPAPANAPRTPGMVYVPAGEFIMGSEHGEVDESPRHVVYTNAFFIDPYEVTNAAYDRCVKAQKCYRSTTRADLKYSAPRQPVAGVGFKDAVAYCRFAGKRLLTEAEWEKAARGTDERTYPWGNTWNHKWLNLHWDKDGFATTATVGSFPKNISPFGAYDMAGNVWEWTSDLWHPTSYRHSPRRNPRGHKLGDADKRRVMRGGTWMYDVPFFSCTHNRSPGRPWIRKRYVGIRCGKDAPPLPGK